MNAKRFTNSIFQPGPFCIELEVENISVTFKRHQAAIDGARN